MTSLGLDQSYRPVSASTSLGLDWPQYDLVSVYHLDSVIFSIISIYEAVWPNMAVLAYGMYRYGRSRGCSRDEAIPVPDRYVGQTGRVEVGYMAGVYPPRVHPSCTHLAAHLMLPLTVPPCAAVGLPPWEGPRLPPMYTLRYTRHVAVMDLVSTSSSTRSMASSEY